MILLQANGFGSTNLIFMLGIIAVMYFFFMRPQMKRQKEQQNFQDNLRNGQEIVTTSGMIGKVSKIHSDSIDIIVGNNTQISMIKSAISKELTEVREKAKQPKS